MSRQIKYSSIYSNLPIAGANIFQSYQQKSKAKRHNTLETTNLTAYSTAGLTPKSQRGFRIIDPDPMSHFLITQTPPFSNFPDSSNLTMSVKWMSDPTMREGTLTPWGLPSTDES